MILHDVDTAAGLAVLKYGPKSGALPRKTLYGAEPGLIPLGDYPDLLIDPRDYKERIAAATAAEMFPMHYQQRWLSLLPSGERWNQDGLNYCWAWGLCASLLDSQAATRPTADLSLLSPITLGGAVKFRNVGNYLGGAIRHAKAHGFARRKFTPDIHSRRPSSFLDGWQADAYENRIVEAYDLDNSTPAKMIQHLISALCYGYSIYCAFDYWRHALSVAGLIWDERQRNNLVVVLRNSHNELDFLHLTGRRAIPSEAYAILSGTAPTRRAELHQQTAA